MTQIAREDRRRQHLDAVGWKCDAVPAPGGAGRCPNRCRWKVVFYRLDEAGKRMTDQPEKAEICNKHLKRLMANTDFELVSKVDLWADPELVSA